MVTIGSKPGGLVYPLPRSKASLQVQSKIREARPDRWLPPPAEVVSALRACIVLVAICGYYSQAALRAVGPLNPPAPYSPGQSPGGEGGPSGWMERT